MIITSNLFWIREEVVEGWHNLRWSVANKLSDSVFSVCFTLSMVLKHPCNSLLFAYPENNPNIKTSQTSYYIKINKKRINGFVYIK